VKGRGLAAALAGVQALGTGAATGTGRVLRRRLFLTLAGLQEAVLAAGFEPVVVELLPALAHISPELNKTPGSI
jgi:hypothetical protein